MFAPKYSIASVYFLGELGGFPMLLITLILGVLILMLLIISPNFHLHPFFISPKYYLVVGLIFVI